MNEHKPRRKRRKRDYIAPGFALVAIVAVGVGWWRKHRQPPPPAIPYEKSMKAELLRVMPPGTSLKAAEPIMRARGYECFYPPPSQFSNLHPMYCDRYENEPGTGPMHYQVIMKNDEKDNIGELIVMKPRPP